MYRNNAAPAEQKRAINPVDSFHTLFVKPLKKSRFTIALPLTNAPEDDVALYHTLTGAFVLMDHASWHVLSQNPNQADFETRQLLRQQGFFLPSGTDEQAVYQSWKHQHMHDFTHLMAKVMVTRRCNLRCRYCVLDSHAGDMSCETADQMDDFYIHMIEQKRPRSVRDEFLGGEPLLNPSLIHKSAERRFAHCQNRGIAYGFTLTTNGTLLSPELISDLKSVGLSGISVSLAGPETVHDALRPAADNAKTYKRILSNLEAVSEMIPVSVECQYDSGAADYRRMPVMFSDFANRGIRIHEIHFTPILPKAGQSDFNCGIGDPEIGLELMDAARQHGYGPPLEAPSNWCLADFRSRFVFDIDGAIIGCPSLEKGQTAYGNVGSGIDFVEESQMLYRQLPATCLDDCSLLPICQGGCRHQALVNHGDFNGIDCNYDAMFRYLEAYLQQRAAQAQADNAV